VNAPSQTSTTAKRASAASTAAAAKTNARPGFKPAGPIELLTSSDEEPEEEIIQDIDSDAFDDDIMDDAPAPAPATTALAEPVIPRQLLARLLLENFDHQDMQIQTGAMKLVGKYMDIFVTEAFLRAKDERKLAAREGSIVDGFLQVEDLEKLAPQLVLDF
jgi:hypothetical protein